MSFIDNFLDLTANLPRQIIRLLKLNQMVEEKSRNIKDNLKEIRTKYLKDFKEKNEKEYEDIINLNNNYQKELLNLSDYKLNLLEELNYIIEVDFLKKLSKIIEEGQKEIREESTSTMLNGINSNYNKNTIEEKNLIINPDKNKKNDRILGNKTNRTNKNISRKRNFGNIENNEELNLIGDEDNKAYCICKGPSYGKMIECDECKNWFHYNCVGIDEKLDPDSWRCRTCLENESNNNMNNSNIKTKRKEKGNKKKKINQK